MHALIGMPQGAEWLYILLIVIVVFGAAKLPDLARSSGQALKIFKDETKSLRDDDSEKTPSTSTHTPPTSELPTAQTDEVVRPSVGETTESHPETKSS